MHMKQESNVKLQCPIPKILLPVDGSEYSRRALQFAGCLGASLGKSLSGITLLHVTAKGFLSRQGEEKISSFFDEGEKILRDAGIEERSEYLSRVATQLGKLSELQIKGISLLL